MTAPKRIGPFYDHSRRPSWVVREAIAWVFIIIAGAILPDRRYWL